MVVTRAWFILFVCTALVCDKNMKGSYKLSSSVSQTYALVCGKKMKGSYKIRDRISACPSLVCDKKMKGSYKTEISLASKDCLYVTGR